MKTFFNSVTVFGKKRRSIFLVIDKEEEKTTKKYLSLFTDERRRTFGNNKNKLEKIVSEKTKASNRFQRSTQQ
jgi:hypothetical protein